MKYIATINQFYKINEALINIQNDIDDIYDNYFKSGVEYIQNSDKLDLNLFKFGEITSANLTEELCKKAHKINPITIYINENVGISFNHYDPFKKEIHLAPNKHAIMYTLEHKSISQAAENLEQKETFLNEFKESRIKGSIHHELVHWIDDSLNNTHIQKILKKHLDKNIPIKDVNYINYEIQAQIHNIVQLKKQNKDIWDDLSFVEMIKSSPSLNVVFKKITNIESKNKWLQKLKSRMYREGLLGKNMFQ
jgi:hypothetical protein